jgi:hypothetical protein
LSTFYFLAHVSGRSLRYGFSVFGTHVQHCILPCSRSLHLLNPNLLISSFLVYNTRIHFTMLMKALPPDDLSVGHDHSMPDSRHQPPGHNIFDTQPGSNGRSSPSLATTTHTLDLTQRLERKLAEYNASENAIKRWLFEILCWCISAICMGAIVAIYARIKDKPMAGTSLLVYTNALSKVASAALIVPTSEALGQLKWNWFSKSRAMWDLEIFDKASR